MVSNSFVQHVAWEMFSPSRFESFISILSHAKCVNNQGTKLNGINLPKYGSMVTKYFSDIAKMKDKAYAPKVYHYLLMTSLACDQLWAHFLCPNYVSVFYHKSRLYYWQIQHFSKSGGWLTRLRQHKTSLFSSLCQWLETQLQLGCLSSEDTPRYPWLPILLIHIWSQVKTRQSQTKKNPLEYMGVLIPDSRESQHLPIWAATMPYPLSWQRNSNLVFWPHAFAWTQQCSII